MKGMLNKKTLTIVFLLLFLTLIVGCFPVINQSPIITSTPITLAEVKKLYTYEVKATDPDSDPLTYSLEVKPVGMTISAATGLIKWTPIAKGDYDVVVKVSDGTLDITQSFTIVVSEAEEPEYVPTPTPTPTPTPEPEPEPVADYYVATTGNNVDGDGSQSNPWKTIQHAIDTVSSGNTIHVAAGTYEESVTVDESVTLQGEDRETTEIKFGYGIYPTEPPLTILADGVTVSGFTIRSGPYIEPAWTIVVEGDLVLLTDLHVIKEPCLWANGSSRIGGSAILIGTPVGGSGVGGVDSFTFTDSIVDSAWNGVYAPRDPGSSNIVVRNVDFTYPGEYAILLMMVTGATIEDNTFTCTADKYGVTVTRGSNSIEIVDNEFVGSDSSEGSHVGILLQAYAEGTMGDVDILRNDISSFNTGILVEDVATLGISIHKNNICGNTAYGVNYPTGLGTVNAINNWWGDASGPYHTISNPNTSGNAVSDNVDFVPFL